MSRQPLVRFFLILGLLPVLLVLSPAVFALVGVSFGAAAVVLGLLGAASGLAAASTGLLLTFLASCATPPVVPPTKQAPVRKIDTGLDRMERLALTVNRCWFKSRDPAFTGYSLAPELSSFSGRPRFLLVPKNRPEERPLLVVEGRSGSAEVDTYGPLLQSPLRARLEGDLARWSAGSGDCSA
ncbi:hypothetical protein M673_10490 [Aureimonas sp. AU20]|nr:hypothetical protein [Aureimonas sp. AU20]ALN73149.1 hypothetical protein M673_10490 [Aureimonas sp. AU20]